MTSNSWTRLKANQWRMLNGFQKIKILKWLEFGYPKLLILMATSPMRRARRFWNLQMKQIMTSMILMSTKNLVRSNKSTRKSTRSSRTSMFLFRRSLSIKASQLEGVSTDLIVVFPLGRYGSIRVAVGSGGEPRTYTEAMSSVESTEWKAPMEEEMASHRENGNWELTQVPTVRRTVGCNWVYKRKNDENGKIARFKARLVAQDFANFHE